jgi:hypothetical protein
MMFLFQRQWSLLELGNKPMSEGKLFKYPRPDLSIDKLSRSQQKALEKHGKVEVCYPVSCRYNGGTTLTPKGIFDPDCRNPKTKWYAGYEVPAPKVPKGYELTSIHCGLQYNCHPPYATMVLRKKEVKEEKNTEEN